MRNRCGWWLAAGAVLVWPLIVTAQPVKVTPGVAAACDRLAAQAARSTGEDLFRQNAIVADEMIAKPFAACRIRIDGSRKRLGDAPMPTAALEQYFEKQRWLPLGEFSADGHDGTVFAYAREGVACLVRGEWDGGSDDEPDAPLADPYAVTIVCGERASFVRPR
jgi:hypothetical protein